MAQRAVTERGVSIRLACRRFGISETCYRYQAKLSDEREACPRAQKQGIRLMFNQPGKPTQNAFVERFSRTVRHEWLDEHLVESVDHA